REVGPRRPDRPSQTPPLWMGEDFPASRTLNRQTETRIVHHPQMSEGIVDVTAQRLETRAEVFIAAIADDDQGHTHAGRRRTRSVSTCDSTTNPDWAASSATAFTSGIVVSWNARTPPGTIQVAHATKSALTDRKSWAASVN